MTRDLRWVILHPGHFHAALVQKEMYPGVSPRVAVYAPLDSDLLAHLGRVAAFNRRPVNPTHWQLEVHADDNFLARFHEERAGDIVVLAGRNARKIEYLERAIAADFHVLADKPWILVPEHLARLSAALAEAKRRGRIVYDIMTERYEITSFLQQSLVQDAAIFGDPVAGTPDEPSVVLESVHALKKLVAGAPLRRPAWFFDVHEQGEGLSDVGTHLVDLVMGILFPEQVIGVEQIQILSANRWPTLLSRDDFGAITGEADFPGTLQETVVDAVLPYHCNTRVVYTIRGIHVRLDVLWNVETVGVGDSHFASFRGSRARVEIRQGRAENYRPELYVTANRVEDHAALGDALAERVRVLEAEHPGLSLVGADDEYRFVIPECERIGHEAHFAEVTDQFLRYVRGEEPLPDWEHANLQTKYHITTTGVALARRSSSPPMIDGYEPRPFGSDLRGLRR